MKLIAFLRCLCHFSSKRRGKKNSKTVTIDDDIMVGASNKETDEIILDKADIDNKAITDDDGHGVFNNAIVYSLRDTTIAFMKVKKVMILQEEEQMAAEIMSWVIFITFNL